MDVPIKQNGFQTLLISDIIKQAGKGCNLVPALSTTTALREQVIMADTKRIYLRASNQVSSRKTGYKQTPEHIKKRIKFGHSHHNWLGDKVTAKSGRSRAQRLYRTIGPCEVCGNEKTERHHIDSNTANNASNNIAILCRRCHMQTDGRLEKLRQLAKSNLQKAILATKNRKIDTSSRTGDLCPCCGRVMSVVGSNKKYNLIYIGCRKSRGGCGYLAGSYRRSPSNA